MKMFSLKKAIASMAVLSMFGFASVAFAGTGIGTTVTMPSPVTVGSSGNATSIQFVNTSTAPDNVNLVTISNIQIKTTAGNTGVFALSGAGTQHVGTSCGSANFTITPAGAGTWNVTPDTVVQQVGVTGTCQIDFTFNVLAFPGADDNGVIAGTQAKLTVSGDAINNTTGADGSAAGSGSTTVNPATPTVTTDIHNVSDAVITSASVGDTVHDSATVIGVGVGPTPTGTVSFTRYSASGCQTGSTAAGNIALVAGVADPSTSVVAAGTSLSFKAHYNGDSNYLAADGPCENLTITKINSNTVTVIHDSNHNATTSVSISTMVHDQATVSGSGPTPTGNVSFQLYSDSTCQSTNGSAVVVALSGGVAETTGTAASGTGMSYKATYAGDANYNGSVGDCEPLSVTKANPNVATDIHNALDQVVTSVSAGTTVHDSATVSGSQGTPTGSVAFTFYGNGTCDSAGISAGSHALVAGVADGSSNEGPLGTGSYSFKAHYNGNSTYNEADGLCEPLTVNQLTPTVTTNIHDANHGTITTAGIGDTVHDSAHVTGSGPTPTGNVDFTFYTGGCDAEVHSSAGTVLLDGSGDAHPSSNEGPLGAGTYAFRAHYVGDVNYAAANGPCEPLTVSQSHPTLGTTPNPGSGTVGVVLNDSATLTGATNPTGSILFSLFPPSDASCAAPAVFTNLSPLVGNTASTLLGFASNAAGVWHWSASYAGDANNASAISLCQSEPVTITQPVVQWCSHGYWKQKQHFDNWVGYAPGDLFSSVFDDAFPGKTLLQVLQQGGGGLNALGRDTVGELLNTAKGLSTGFTTAQIIANFNAVFPGTNAQYDALHNTFVAPESCPLN